MTEGCEEAPVLNIRKKIFKNGFGFDYIYLTILVFFKMFSCLWSTRGVTLEGLSKPQVGVRQYNSYSISLSTFKTIIII